MKKPSGRSPIKPVPPTAVGSGRGRGGMTPPPGMMYGPDDRLIPVPKKGGMGSPKPSRVMGGPADKMGPVRGTAKGPAPMPAMKKGGMVKGKKK